MSFIPFEQALFHSLRLQGQALVAGDYSRHLPRISLFLCGRCRPNPGNGFYSGLIQYPDSVQAFSGSQEDTTSNLIMLQAAVAGLALLCQPYAMAIYTHNQWLVQTAQGRYSRSADLHQPLWEALERFALVHDLTWHWCRAFPPEIDGQLPHQLTAEVKPVSL